MSAGARARLFVALELPVEVADALAGWARRARRGSGSMSMRLVDAEMLHVTLCFLGSRPVEEIAVLGAAVEAGVASVLPPAGRGVGRLSLGAPLWLPPRRPRVLAVEVHDGGGGLGSLQAAVCEQVAAAIEWEPEKRRFRPHVTVARMPAGAAPRGRELEPTPAVEFEGSAVTLFRSWLARGGATYEALERVEV